MKLRNFQKLCCCSMHSSHVRLFILEIVLKTSSDSLVRHSVAACKRPSGHLRYTPPYISSLLDWTKNQSPRNLLTEAFDSALLVFFIINPNLSTVATLAQVILKGNIYLFGDLQFLIKWWYRYNMLLFLIKVHRAWGKKNYAFGPDQLCLGLDRCITFG